MTQEIIISIPLSHPYSNNALYEFKIKYRGIFDIHYRRSTKNTVTFSSTRRLRNNINFMPLREDFYNTFSHFKESNSTMKNRPSDIFNNANDIALAKSIQTKALASERNAQERALMEQYGITKTVIYTSKDHQFAEPTINEVIEKIKSKQYVNLLEEVTNHLTTLEGNTGIRDVIEYITANYTLEKIKE